MERKLSDHNSSTPKLSTVHTKSIPLIVALELLCSISSFAGFEKRGVEVVSLHIAYFCILTAGPQAYRIPDSS